MITVRLKIGEEGAIQETNAAFGLVYVSSDNRFSAPVKEYESVTYPEEEGEHIIEKTVYAPFEYTVKFYINAEETNSSGTLLSNANKKIRDFNSQIFTEDETTHTLIPEKVYFYNDYKKVLIVGYPLPMEEATDFWRDSTGKAHDIVVSEWKIRVTKPSECNFNLEEE